MKASLAQAERKPDELKEAMEKLGQTPPSNRQLMVLRLMGLISPSEDAPRWHRVRGFLLLLAIVFVLLAIGFGLANLVALPFGGVGTLGAMLIGFVIIVAVLGVLTLLGRRRQAKAQAAARAQRR
jgi:drug/metabolite transporter (DMT)-like permease